LFKYFLSNSAKAIESEAVNLPDGAEKNNDSGGEK
jgi:hypothetical protein